MLEVKPTGQRIRMATRTGQSVQQRRLVTAFDIPFSPIPIEHIPILIPIHKSFFMVALCNRADHNIFIL